MAWVWFVGGGLLALIGSVCCVGALLPREHTATRSLVVPLPPAAVWAKIRDASAFASWRSSVTGVDGVEGDPAAPSRYVEVHGRSRIPLAVERAESPATLVTRIDDPSLPFGGTWTFDLAPEASGTRVRITERGFVSLPPFRFVAKFLIGHTKTIDAYLGDLARATGTAPNLEP